MFAGNWWDDKDDSSAVQFSRLLQAYGMVQHVNCATHHLGHTLDLFLTRETESVISEVLVLPGLSDHSAVSCDITLQKPEPVKKVIVTRKWKSFSRLHEILSEIDVEKVSIEESINLYESFLTELFDELCPLKARTITLRENSPWYNDDIRAVKQLY